MGYHEKERAKVNLALALAQEGWKLFGFHEDNSDMMTDYYSPAWWTGIATKEGYILVVDDKFASNSGYKEVVRHYNETSLKSNERDLRRLESLKNITVERGASEQEQETAQKAIAEIEARSNKCAYTEEVKAVYPEYKANPSNYNWHIQDTKGNIIAMGKGLNGFSFYTWMWDFENKKSDRKLDESKQKEIDNLYKLVNKINKAIVNPKYMYFNTGKQVEKTSIKPIKQEDRKSLKVGDVITLAHHGHYWMVVDEFNQKQRDGSMRKCFTYELLGSEKRGYQRLNGLNAKRYYNTEKQLNTMLEDGRVNIYSLEEVREIEVKDKWTKVDYINVDIKKENTEIMIESKEVVNTQEATQTPVQTAEEQTKEIKDTEAKEEVTQENNNNIHINFNEEKNGIEIKFDDKPSQEVLENLKLHGFRWSKYQKIWYAKDTPERREFIKILSTDITDSTTTNTSKEMEYPTININDINETTYPISKEISKRENEGHGIFRKEERDHQKELLSLLFSFNNNIEDALEGCENSKIIYHAHKWLQSYKKRYYNNYYARLKNDANNPSWVVTGRSGRNANKDIKYNERYDKLMRECVNLQEEFKSKYASVKRQVARSK